MALAYGKSSSVAGRMRLVAQPGGLTPGFTLHLVYSQTETNSCYRFKEFAEADLGKLVTRFYPPRIGRVEQSAVVYAAAVELYNFVQAEKLPQNLRRNRKRLRIIYG